MAIGDDNPGTPVERLCALFKGRGVRSVKTDHLTGQSTERRYAGLRSLALAIGCHRTLISKWNRDGGSVPLAWRTRVMEAADGLGIERAALADILPAERCPCCGQMVEPGAVHA